MTPRARSRSRCATGARASRSAATSSSQTERQAARRVPLRSSGRLVRRTGDPGLPLRLALLPGTLAAAIAVGPSGSDLTTDGGKSWKTFSKADFDSVQCVEGGPAGVTCWASGADGAVGTLRIRKR